MQFQYQAKTTSGSTTTGLLDAISIADARQQLRARGLFPVQVDRRGSGSFAQPKRTRGKPAKRDLLMVTTQLSIMVRSGLDLADALENVARQTANVRLSQALNHIHQDLQDGQSFSAALREQSHIFGEAYVASVAAGEASGRLPEVLVRLNALLRNEVKLRSALRTVVTYPIVLTVVAGVVIGALVFFVLPQFQQVFDSLGTAPPAMTNLLLDVGSSARKYAWLLVIFAFIVVVVIGRSRRSQTVRRNGDWIALHCYGVRGGMRSLLTGRSFRLMGTLLESGVPLLDAIRLCKTSVQNQFFQHLFDQMEREILNGRGIAGELAINPYIPIGAAEMIATAEKTGQLGPVMQLVGEYFEEEGERLVRDLVRLLEPAIIVAMGVIVAFVVAAVMLPLLDVSTATTF